MALVTTIDWMTELSLLHIRERNHSKTHRKKGKEIEWPLLNFESAKTTNQKV